MAFPYAAVLFDLDGTLVDSIADLADAMNYALALQGLPGHELPAYRLMVGEGVETLVRRALPAERSALVPRVLADFRDRYAGHYADKTLPYPGIADLLARLSAAGLKLAVLSNKREDFTQAVVRALLPGARFEQVRGERANVPRKPDPTAALELARDLGVAPSACAFVGDTAVDMDTARSAGMVAVGVLWGFRSKEELLSHGAKVLLAHPLELLDVAGP
jgi:phosphoglycolate phosphatase